MSKASPIITNLSAGEWSARMEGRVELEKYYSSCRILKNMLVVSQGGADFRPGTKFIVNGKTNADTVRLIPFSIKNVGEYILELGDKYIRFIKCSTHAQIESAPDTPYEVVTLWDKDDLFELKYAQTQDAMYFVHPSYAPRKLIRTTDTNWSLETPTFSGWLKSSEIDIEGITQANPAVITSTDHGLVTSDVVYITDVVGMLELNCNIYVVTKITDDTFSLDNTDSSTYTAYVSGGHVRKAGNIFGSANNYPAAIAFYQQRLILGGTNNYPDKVWLSKVGDVLDFKMPEGLEFQVWHNRGLILHWLAGKSEIAFGADSCEGVVSGAPISDANYQLRVESGYGVENVQGQLVNERIIFIQDGGKRVREFAYHEEAAGWLSPDLTLFADHITGDGIVETAVQRSPDTILWCVRSDGVLAALTYEYRYGVAGWSRIVMADSGIVESIAIVRGTSEDEIYVSVQRTVNDTTKRFIEYFAPRDFGSDQADAFFVDSGITWDGDDEETLTDITQAEPPVVACASHPFSDGDLVRFSDVVGTDTGYVDLRDFAEIDENARIDVADYHSMSVTELYRDEDGILYRHLGHEFLDGSFEYTFKFTPSTFPTSAKSMCGIWGVCDVGEKHLDEVDDDGDYALAIIARRSSLGAYKFQAWELRSGWDYTVTFDMEFSLATAYYFKVERTATGGTNDCGTFTVSIYSDAGMTTLIETQTMNLHDVISYEYIYMTWNYKSTDHEYSSFSTEDLKGPANRGSWNNVVFKVDSAGADDFELDDEDDNDINGYHYEEYVSGGTVQKVIQTVTGLDHLEGEEVAVLVDGGTHPEETVSSGSITLDRYGNKIHAGLPYSPELKLMRIEAGGDYGTAQGKKKRIRKVIIRVYKSLNCKVGPDEDHLTTVLFREGDAPMDSPPELFSGDKVVSFDGPWERAGDIYITSDTPTPLNILAVMPEVETHG